MKNNLFIITQYFKSAEEAERKRIIQSAVSRYLKNKILTSAGFEEEEIP